MRGARERENEKATASENGSGVKQEGNEIEIAD
jgi:hypothetical protein